MSQFKQLFQLHFGQIFTFRHSDVRNVFIGFDGKVFNFKPLNSEHSFSRSLNEKHLLVVETGQNRLLTPKQLRS